MTVDYSDRYEGVISRNLDEMDFYTGPEAKRWDTNVSAGTHLRWDPKSKWNRVHENQFQQSQLDDLTKFAQESGLGDFTASVTSEPGWNISENRDTRQRLGENIWQESQIADLERWAGTIAPTHGLTFSPSELNILPSLTDEEAVHDASRTKNLYTQNVNQKGAIDNLHSFLSDFEGKRDENYSKDSWRENNRKQYGDFIDSRYTDLFERDADEAGKEYWINQLTTGAAGLEAGDSWKGWIDRALMGSNEFKDLQANKPPEDLFSDGSTDLDVGTGLESLTANFSDLLADEKEKWDLQYEKMDAFNQNQINELKSIFASTNKANQDLIKGYREAENERRKESEARAAYGERPMNQSVKGVKTRNELPGYKPKTGGSTGHFNRTGARLSTQSLNVA